MNDSLATRIEELEADNRRLRRLLDKKDAPAELRHRLNSTLAVLRVIIRKSAEGKGDLDQYVGHLEDRITAIGRAQAAIDSRGVVDLHGLIADELLLYGTSEGDRLTVTGPTIHLQPRAGQLMALAIHELAVNAVQHGGLGSGIGEVQLSWSVARNGAIGRMLRIKWKESGTGAIAEPRPTGFGTEVLTKTLRYELKAETEFVFSKNCMTCEISIPFTDSVGRVGG